MTKRDDEFYRLAKLRAATAAERSARMIARKPSGKPKEAAEESRNDAPRRDADEEARREHDRKRLLDRAGRDARLKRTIIDFGKE